MDGVKIQSGAYPWKTPGGASANLQFYFDFGALSNKVTSGSPPFNSIVLTPDKLPITYEVDYSRVWERQ